MSYFNSQIDESGEPVISLSSHPRAKEWLISASRASYQELAKIGQEFPQLVRLQVSAKNTIQVPERQFYGEISKKMLTY